MIDIIYVSVNAIRHGWRSRTRDAIGAIRHVFLEADEDGAGVLSRVAMRSDLPKLSYVLHSSPNKVHLFWRVEGFSPEHVEALQKQLARELGTDTAATPRTQATRLPGFLNHKYQPPHPVSIEYRCPTRRLSMADFPTSEAECRERYATATPGCYSTDGTRRSRAGQTVPCARAARDRRAAWRSSDLSRLLSARARVRAR